MLMRSVRDNAGLGEQRFRTYQNLGTCLRQTRRKLRYAYCIAIEAATPEAWRYILFAFLLTGADGETRTRTACATTPSR